MKCCVNCFRDETIVETIEEEGDQGTCDFCESTDILTMECRELWPLFEPVVRLYSEVSSDNTPPFLMGGHGETIATLLNQDWDVFSDVTCDRMDDLMRAVIPEAMHKDDIGAFPDSRALHISYEDAWWYTSPSEYWDSFVYHITHERRFIPATDDINRSGVHDPRDWLPEIASSVSEQLRAGESIWRTRRADEVDAELKKGEEPGPDELGSPPPDRARAARANPEGIPVFYGALEAYTAAAEARPAIGQSLYLSRWELLAGVQVVDLTKSVPIGSPFGYETWRLQRRLEHREFIRSVSWALARPVLPQEERLGYIPTQYVVEVIRDAGYDGVIYRSAQDPAGNNVVLFDSGVLELRDWRKSTARTIEVSFDPPIDR